MHVVNIAGYKFVALTDLKVLRDNLASFCAQTGLKGTILLSAEGTNQMLAGSREQINAYRDYLLQDSRFHGLAFKESVSNSMPFQRLRVKIKPEIITMGLANLAATDIPEKRVSPQELKQWLDEQRSVTLLDTRNAFEVNQGTFTKAQHLSLDNFGQFPEASMQLAPELKNKPMIIFCTGGIRCEKAAVWLQRQGFTDVYQLDGGILNYFAECGDAHYQGTCFIFDGRGALDSRLMPCGTESE
jgi:UPF0176 protein